MRIAIVGGTSFIGQNLIVYFLKRNVKLISTYNNNKNIKNKFPKVKWKKLDFKTKKNNYFKYLENPDIVINLSWPDIPNYKVKKHFKTFKYQKRFNYNLINNGLKNLMFLGTCFEYGKKNGKISEKTKPKPIIPYSIAKLNVLKSLLQLKKKKKFKLSWLRPFHVYGNNKKRKTLFTIIKNLNEINGKFKINGKLVRDFVPVDFLCKVIVKLSLKNDDFGILNVCSGKGTSIQNFIKKNLKNKKNIKKFNMNGKVYNSFEPNKFWGDPTKLKKVLEN